MLTTLVGYYEASEQATETSRTDAESWRDYRNGDQWTAEEIATLEKRKQPVITIDRIGPKVDFLLGMEASRRTDPKAYPRTPKEEENANAATDALRFVMDQSQWDEVRSQSFDTFIVEGDCGADVAVVEKYGEPCIEVRFIPWDRRFADPHSRRRDYSDAKYKGQFVWMDLDDAIEKWPEHADALSATMESARGQTYEDVPKLRWADPKRRRVRIVEIWTREPEGIFYTKYTKGGILERMPTPYRNEHGEEEDGFEFGSCYIDRDGNRFGVVKRWTSLQDEINKRRSKAMHLMSVRQTYGNQGAGDKNQLRRELAKPDGHVEMLGGAKYGEDFGIIPTNDMAKAQFDLLQESKAEIDNVGVNAALSGTESRNMSGRALMARQEQGLNELGPVFDWFKSWQLQVYRKVWNRIRQFWTAEKWIRVTDNEQNVRFVGINQPLTLGAQLLEEFKRQPGVGPEQIASAEQQAQFDPRMQTVVGTKNNVAEMDVDITLDDAPASAALQIEQFQTLADLAGKGVPIPPDELVMASNLRNKDAIAERMRGGSQGPAVQPELMQALQAMQQQIGQLTQQLQDKRADQLNKARETEIKAYQAETDRFEAMKPEPMPQLATSPDISR